MMSVVVVDYRCLLGFCYFLLVLNSDALVVVGILGLLLMMLVVDGVVTGFFLMVARNDFLADVRNTGILNDSST